MSTEVRDLRMVVMGAAAWLGALAARTSPLVVALLVVATLVVATAVAWSVRRWPEPGSTARRRTVLAAVAVALAAGAVTAVHHHAVSASPVAHLASERAAVTLTATVRSDPVAVAGRFGDQTLVRLDVTEVSGRGSTSRLHAPVLVLGSPAWLDVPLGSRVRVQGRLAPADDPALAGLLTGGGAPTVLAPPAPWWRVAGVVRAGIRGAVAHRPTDQRVLVPALVDGDDAGLDPDLADDFRTTGLTHLTAVSGTNLTLMLAFLLGLARLVGVRGRWLLVVGALAVAGFVLLARGEPSVLRAAVMGVVGLLALRTDGARRGPRALGVAVVVLLLVDPDLAVSAGFALSVLATAGIVLVAPRLRSALARWCPAPVAEAVAVPLAAQLACTPVIAALSGQVSLVAVAANLLVAPAVAPATVLGLVGGLVFLVVPAVGGLLGTLAGWSVGWIVLVAERGADLPLAAVGWGTGAVALGALAALVLASFWLLPRVLARRGLALALTVALVLACVGLVRGGGPLPLPWLPGPPDDWVFVACDVGQGDALVVRAAAHAAVVVDAGPDPDLVDGCLRRLGVTDVPLLVLTHFHADHVDGLSGVLAGRTVGRVWTTDVLDPTTGVESVQADLERAADGGTPVPAGPVALGTSVEVGEASLQVLWPASTEVTPGPGDGTAANDASVVLLAEVEGVRLLLTGDVEPDVQERIAAEIGDPAALGVDVLKVPHHGSRYQDLDLLTALQAPEALISVGADNDYGHPSSETVDALEAAGTDVHRTDQEGDLVVRADGEVVASG